MLAQTFRIQHVSIVVSHKDLGLEQLSSSAIQKIYRNKWPLIQSAVICMLMTLGFQKEPRWWTLTSATLS